MKIVLRAHACTSRSTRQITNQVRVISWAAREIHNDRRRESVKSRARYSSMARKLNVFQKNWGHFTVFVLLQTGHLETCFFHRNYSWVYFKSLNAWKWSTLVPLHMITKSNLWNFNFWGGNVKCVADRKWSEFYFMLEKPKVLSIHLFSKILSPAYLYLNAIGIFWRKFDSKMFKNDRGG